MMRAWSDAAEDKLRALYATTPLPRLAFLLKRTEKAVRSRAKVLGLRRSNRRPWTPADDRELRRRYPTQTAVEIGSVLGRSPSCVYNRARKLWLSKPEGYAAAVTKDRWRNGRNEGSRASQFRPGQKPPNKGLRRPGWAPGRMRETQFKKGQMAGAAARNYKPIGSLRVSAYNMLERKVTDDHPVPARRWVAVSRLVWEAAHGPVPAGHAVAFKPGRHTLVESEITLDVIELVTRAELMRRNSYHTRYPPEVRSLIQLRAALNRKINRRDTP